MEREELLAKYTNDEYYFYSIDKIAFNAQDLKQLQENGEKTIYICADGLTIDSEYRNIRYIGVKKFDVIYDVGDIDYDLELTGIVFENLRIILDESRPMTISSIEDIYSLKKDSFETEAMYTDKIASLTSIHCGIAILEKERYDAEEAKFYVTVKWFNCFKNVMQSRCPETEYFFKIEPARAKNLFKKGACRPIYVNVATKGAAACVTDVYMLYSSERIPLLISDITSPHCKADSRSALPNGTPFSQYGENISVMPVQESDGSYVYKVFSSDGKEIATIKANGSIGNGYGIWLIDAPEIC